MVDGNEQQITPKGALDGIRVVDWTQMIAGPLATGLLAALGAEVIHVERLGMGDAIRGIVRWGGLDYRLPGGRNLPMEIYNRNKKSLAVNLQTKRGIEIMHRLVEKSDVFVTNFSRSRAKEFELHYESLKTINPRLIYGSATVYGPKGPDSDLPGYDFLGQARSGVTLTLGEKGDVPIPGTPNMSDQVTGVALGYGIVVALLARERLGTGQEVHASQLGAMMSIIMEGSLANILNCGQDQARFVRTERRNPLSNCYQSKDGRWIFITMLFDEHLKLLSKMIDMPELAEDPRFSSIYTREENRHALIAILDKVFEKRTLNEWLEIAHRYQAPLTVANRLEDLLTDPQVISNEYIIEFDHTGLGRKMKFAGYPFQLSETPPTIVSAAPECGQHTEEILIDICGYSWTDIQDLKEKEVI